MVKKLFLNPFLKNQNRGYLWIKSLKFYAVCFCCMPSWGLSNILKLCCKPLAFTYVKFKKTKRRLELSLLTSFCMIFEEKYFSCYSLLTDQMSLSGCLFWDIGQHMYCNCLLTRSWRHNFDLKISFYSSRFFYMTKMPRQKFKYLENKRSF